MRGCANDGEEIESSVPNRKLIAAVTKAVGNL